MKRTVIAMVVAGLGLGTVAQSSFAMPQFKKAFDEKYTNKSDNSEFKAAAKKAACNICHLKGDKKEVQNDYGKELNKLVEGDAQQRLKDATAAGRKDEELAKLLSELEAAFKKVETVKNSEGETYGDRLKAHKLPFEPKE